MCSGKGDWTCLQPGFPIRKSTDHSLVIDSPWLIADSYVLHRFLVPRHPPCALKNLAKDARVHCVVLNIQAAPDPQRPPTPKKVRYETGTGPNKKGKRTKRPDPSGPNNVPGTDHTHPTHAPRPPPKGEGLYW